MRFRLMWFAFAVLCCSSHAVAAIATVLASCRGGWVEFVDARTLQPIGRIMTGHAVENVAASPDGRTLFLTASLPEDSHGCCALYGVDLAKRTIKFLLEPTLQPMLAGDGSIAYAQRGDTPVSVFDIKTFKRKPDIEVNRFSLRGVSPDNRYLFGVSAESETSTLEIYDTRGQRVIQRLPLAQAIDNSGSAWLDNALYLYGNERGKGHLWRITATTTAVDNGTSVSIPAFADQSTPYLAVQLTGASGRLFVHEMFGMKLDRRDESTPDVPGGIYEVNPKTGIAGNALAPEAHFARVAVSPDGNSIFGIDVESLSSWEHVRLVRINRATGQIEASRELPSDVWDLAYVNIPPELIPHSDIELSTR